jgi:hypothetical protein
MHPGELLDANAAPKRNCSKELRKRNRRKRNDPCDLLDERD